MREEEEVKFELREAIKREEFSDLEEGAKEVLDSNLLNFEETVYIRGSRLLLFTCTPPYITVATRPRIHIVRAQIM
jgi:hypothetical protein